MTDIQVSRTFEPLPQLLVEARYRFEWTDGGLDRVMLEKRNPAKQSNPRWDKVESIRLRDVPNDVKIEARDRLKQMAAEISQ